MGSLYGLAPDKRFDPDGKECSMSRQRFHNDPAIVLSCSSRPQTRS